MSDVIASAAAVEAEEPLGKPLLLPSLEIRGFRTFDHLRIERLGRVNLIVGKNNVGKTALLEALRLYAHRGAPRVMRSILLSRDEIGREPLNTVPSLDARLEAVETSGVRIAYESLFHGRKPLTGIDETMSIGPIDSEARTLQVSLLWSRREQREDQKEEELLSEVSEVDSGRVPRLEIKFGDKLWAAVSLADAVRQENARTLYESRFRFEPVFPEERHCLFVQANGLTAVYLARLWDDVVLNNQEEEVIQALQIISSDVQRVFTVADPITERDRIFVVKMQQYDRPVPLRSLGDGMNRLLGIVLALIHAKDGLLLLDEFENGLHYSVQPDIWRLIFALAANDRLNVQVFATTHSWDCLEAFQQAAGEHKEDGVAMRLECKKDEIRAVLFDEEDLEIITSRHIEVR